MCDRVILLNDVMLIDKTSTCCFTGHRPAKMSWRTNEDDYRCLELKERIFNAVDAVYKIGVRHYISGMAIGCDFYFCDAVILLRSQKPGVTLEAAVPWEGQAESWSSKLRDRYYRLMADCDYETVVQTDYSFDCMVRRNRYMVDKSNYLIAAYNGSTGGTLHTMNYAKSQGIQVIELPF